MTRHEKFAAAALQGLLAARTNLDSAVETRTAWDYADGMEAEAKRRDLVAFADERPADLPITVTAAHEFAAALTEGMAAATGAGCEFTNRDRRIVTEVLDAYGTAEVAGPPFFGRCQLTHRFCDVSHFLFAARNGVAS